MSSKSAVLGVAATALALCLSPLGAMPAEAATVNVVGQLWDGKNADGSKFTNISQDVLHEPSGIGASQTNPGIMYAHSEKDKQTLVAFQMQDAKIVGKYRITIPNVWDWEDMAVGPCPAGSCLYAGDVGNYKQGTWKKTGVWSITRVPEPNIKQGRVSGTLPGAQTFFFRYPDGNIYDSEAIMVDPRTSRIYVLTKDSTGVGTSMVFAFPNSTPAPGSTTTLQKVATLKLRPNSETADGAVTAAAVHPTRNRFIVRTYKNVYEFRGANGGTLKSALASKPTELTDTKEGQGEAIDYAIDGKAYYTLSERAQAPYTLKWVTAP